MALGRAKSIVVRLSGPPDINKAPLVDGVVKLICQHISVKTSITATIELSDTCGKIRDGKRGEVTYHKKPGGKPVEVAVDEVPAYPLTADMWETLRAAKYTRPSQRLVIVVSLPKYFYVLPLFSR